jgi:hypothetical protein
VAPSAARGETGEWKSLDWQHMRLIRKKANVLLIGTHH